MEQYHGTNSDSANYITNGMIDISLGGGELGLGFYTGDLAFEAFNWAWHKHKKDKAVIQFSIGDFDFLNLNPLCLNLHETQSCRRRIRDAGETRYYVFRCNLIWAPVVGKHFLNFNQFKYESKTAENFLNSNSVQKSTY